MNDIVALYERHAQAYDRDRSRSLLERVWLERFFEYVPGGGTVLDLGCGMGEPIARYILDRGFQMVGVDTSAPLIALCRARFQSAEWLLRDMRTLDLDRKFQGVLAWDSFFHLGPDDQRTMFPVFGSHAADGAPLMFTSGPAEGEAIGSYQGDRLYHWSYGPEEYERLLAENGFRVRMYVPEDPDCGGHTIWLSTLDTGGKVR